MAPKPKQGKLDGFFRKAVPGEDPAALLTVRLAPEVQEEASRLQAAEERASKKQRRSGGAAGSSEGGAQRLIANACVARRAAGPSSPIACKTDVVGPPKLCVAKHSYR